MKTKSFDDSEIRFPVERERLVRADGSDTMYDAIWRKTDGRQLSVVSRDYQLVEHGRAVDFILEALRGHGVRVEPWRFALTNEGKRMLYEMRLPGYSFEVDKEDRHELTLKIGNSIDKSRSFTLDFGTWRKVCKNGAHVGVRVYYVQESHYQNNIRFDPIGKELLNRMDDAVDVYRKRTEQLLQAEADRYLTQLIQEFPVLFVMSVTQELEGNYEFERVAKGGLQAPVDFRVKEAISAYALLQILTKVATHQVVSKARRIQLDQRISRLMR